MVELVRNTNNIIADQTKYTKKERMLVRTSAYS